MRAKERSTFRTGKVGVTYNPMRLWWNFDGSQVVSPWFSFKSFHMPRRMKWSPDFFRYCPRDVIAPWTWDVEVIFLAVTLACAIHPEFSWLLQQLLWTSFLGCFGKLFCFIVVFSVQLFRCLKPSIRCLNQRGKRFGPGTCATSRRALWSTWVTTACSLRWARSWNGIGATWWWTCRANKWKSNPTSWSATRSQDLFGQPFRMMVKVRSFSKLKIGHS